MIKKIRKIKNGYTLVEVLFYVALFAILSVVLLDVLIMMTGLFMKTMVNSDITQGSIITENISRELKQADDFSFSSGILVVDTKDDSNNDKTITYTFSNSNIQITDSVRGNLGNLNTPNVSVVDFDVITINTLKGKAAKINMTVRSNRDPENNTEDFENTIVLRGDY